METVPVCAGALLEVLALGSIAALTPVGVQFAGVKHLSVISGPQLCTKHTMKPLQTLSGGNWIITNQMWRQKTFQSKSNWQRRTYCAVWVKVCCLLHSSCGTVCVLHQRFFYRVSQPRAWRVSGLYPDAVWTDCVQRPVAALQRRPSRLYSDLNTIGCKRERGWCVGGSYFISPSAAPAGDCGWTYRHTACEGRWRRCWFWVCLLVTCRHRAQGEPAGGKQLRKIPWTCPFVLHSYYKHSQWSVCIKAKPQQDHMIQETTFPILAILKEL